LWQVARQQKAEIVVEIVGWRGTMGRMDRQVSAVRGALKYGGLNGGNEEAISLLSLGQGSQGQAAVRVLRQAEFCRAGVGVPSTDVLIG
jgi:hypothetical protein